MLKVCTLATNGDSMVRRHILMLVPVACLATEFCPWTSTVFIKVQLVDL
jgi:hypothetical protein